MSGFRTAVQARLADRGPRAQALKRLLLRQRDKARVPIDGSDNPLADLRFDRTDWVSMWMDVRHVVHSADGSVSMARGITVQGRLLWMVRKKGLQRAYHARATDPFDAMAEAEDAWRRRKEQRVHKDRVKAIVRDLRSLRVRYQVTLDDAYTSPLCDEGVDGFLRSLGISGYHRYPGWLIAWLYAFDRQVGFVLFEAHKRREALERQIADEVAQLPLMVGGDLPVPKE